VQHPEFSYLGTLNPVTFLYLQDEVAATRVNAIMYRKSIHTLKELLSQHQSRLLLKGPVGTGKSLAVASLVEWARASGW
jgi:MoxR-like ATPase